MDNHPINNNRNNQIQTKLKILKLNYPTRKKKLKSYNKKYKKCKHWLIKAIKHLKNLKKKKITYL